MKRILTVLLLNCAVTAAFAQIGFEKGYFIGKDGIRTDCLIKNNEWLNSPDEIKYKIGEEGEVHSANMDAIAEFVVSNTRYVKAAVEIDRSSTDTRKLSHDSSPEWSKAELFLKVLVEGQATLYRYRESGLEKFFFRVNDVPIRQLLYKIYLSPQTQTRDDHGVPLPSTRINGTYYSQLEKEVSCGGVSIAEIKKVNYDTKSLKAYFIKYNQCSNSDPVDRETETRTTKFHLRLTPGIDQAQGNFGYPYTTKLPKASSFRIGLEGEFVLPFNRNKWSILLEPTYQSYKASQANQAMDYASIEIPIGIRHRFFLSEHSQLFINLAGVVDLPIRYDLKFSSASAAFDAKKTSLGAAAGVGLAIGRLSLEARYYSARNVYVAEYQKVSAIFGLKIF